MAKKLYHKIGEACRKLDIQPYVLRYWETEFPFLRPDKSRSGQRVYTEQELELIARIKELLYDEGYTIAGAKKKLEAELESGGPAPKNAKAKSRPKAQPSAKQPVQARLEPSQLDTADGDRIETIARQLRELHAEATEILGLIKREAS